MKKQIFMLCVVALCFVGAQTSAALLAWYSFEEDAIDSADITDDGGGNRAGTLENDAFIDYDPLGQRGKVLNLIEDNDARLVLNNTNSTSNWLQDNIKSQHTIMMWAQFDKWPKAWAPALFSKGSDYALCRVNANDYFGWGIANTVPTAYRADSSTDTADGQWHHYAATYNGSTVKIFIDGVEEGSVSASGTMVTNSSFAYVGASYASGYGLNGRIDDVGLFNSAMSIGAMDGSEAGTINYYRVRGVTGTVPRCVLVTTDDSTDGELSITLTASGGLTELVGAAITVTSTTAITDVSVSSYYNVFIDSAHTLGSAYDYPGTGSNTGIPTADPDDPGELDLPATSFSICIVGLDDDGIGEGTEEALSSCTIVLDCAAGSSDVDIALDTLRGGAISYDGPEMVYGLPALDLTIDAE